MKGLEDMTYRKDIDTEQKGCGLLFVVPSELCLAALTGWHIPTNSQDLGQMWTILGISG